MVRCIIYALWCDALIINNLQLTNSTVIHKVNIRGFISNYTYVISINMLNMYIVYRLQGSSRTVYVYKILMYKD